MIMRIILPLCLFMVSTAFSETGGATWFEGNFLTEDGSPLGYGGTRDYTEKETLQNTKGVGGDYVFSAIGKIPGFDGFVEVGSRNGAGLTIKNGEIQTANSWSLADVPRGKVLRFEAKGVYFDKDITDRESSGYQGFGLSTDRAVINHDSKDDNGFFWTFYGVERGEDVIRPYVQMPERRFSQETKEIKAAISTDPQNPDTFVIEFDPQKECVRFFMNTVEIYSYFFDEVSLKQMLGSKIRIAYYDLDQGLGRSASFGSWSLQLVDSERK